MERGKVSSLDKSLQRLVKDALAAKKHAYAPYSEYNVGSVVEDIDGNIFSGCNVENASYPVVSCAERVAIGTMVCAGSRQIRRVVVAASSKQPVFPCGICLQVIGEFGPEADVIALSDDGKDFARAKFSELQPYHFSQKEVL